MTESGFMTNEAWDKLTPSIIKGIRANRYLHANPDWWALKVVDG